MEVKINNMIKDNIANRKIKIIFEDTERGIHWQSETASFEIAEMELDRIKRNYEKILEKEDEEASDDDCSADYPLGRMIEPYDIWREENL